MAETRTGNFTVNINNLFAGGELFILPNGEQFLDERIYTRPIRPIIIATHTVTASDELTQLAHRYYNGRVPDASKYWHAIARYNTIDNPLDLSEYVGVQIFIPDPQQYISEIQS